MGNIKNLFHHNRKKDNDFTYRNRNLISKTEYTMLYQNDAVNNIYAACTLCYNKQKPLSYDDKIKYIEKRIAAGHESILEHGWMTICISNLLESKIIDLTKATSGLAGKYLTVTLSQQQENDTYNVLIGGSIRAFRQFIMANSNNLDNTIVQMVIRAIMENSVEELYKDIWAHDKESLLFGFLCNNGGFVKQPSINPINSKVLLNYDDIQIIPLEGYNCDKTVYIGIDHIELISDTFKRHGFSIDDMKNYVVCSIEFNNISRSASNQLVRHRNAITQESQRYVNASNASFTIPRKDYIQDYQNKIYNLKFKHPNGRNMTYELTEQKLADLMIRVYSQLTDQGLRKEDARSYLPMNVNSKVIMTFTLNNLTAFLDMRCDEHAQTEIRDYANVIKQYIPSIE